MMEKILIVDDELDIQEFIQYNLEKDGFKVDTAATSNDALEKVKSFNPDLILLDVMLPDVDGIETCQKIRNLNTSSKPVIAFLTARSEDYSQIAGLEAGGDDYIAKPIKPKILISRIKALLRRKNDFQSDVSSIQIGYIRLDQESYVCYKSDEEIHLPRKQFNILTLLMKNAGKVIRRDDLMSQIWGDVFVSDRNIDVQIRKIREKIGEELIKTVKGVGYKFLRINDIVK